MANETNMIAACPRCRARYRIEARRLKSEGLRLRCSSCDAVFRVTPPPTAGPAPAARAAAPAPEAPVVAEPPVPQPSAPEPVAAQLPTPEPPTLEPPARKPAGAVVLLADSDVDAGKRTAHALSDWGYTPVLVHDGVEAILTIQRLMPRAVVLDAGLPKMFGFQICELMKRNESLRSIEVVLVGAIHDQARYRREPNDLYGADAYIERPQLPEALRAVLRGFGIGPDAESSPAPDAQLQEPEGERLAPEPAPPPPLAEPMVPEPTPELEPMLHEPTPEPRVREPASESSQLAFGSRRHRPRGRSHDLTIGPRKLRDRTRSRQRARGL